MTDKKNKAKPKRLSRGHRKHVRRLKQAARKAGITYRHPVREQTPTKMVEEN